MAENMLINYKRELTYSVTDNNAIGATTSTTLRTITTPAAGTTNYVRKFGTQYLITDVTDLSDPGVANLTWTWKALDGTTMGSRTNGGAFVDGSTVSSQGCFLEASASGGAAVLPATMTVDTDADVGGLTINLPTETVADGSTITFYIADSGSTYYDTGLMYGGARHTPAVGDSRLAYFHPEAADTALGARTIVHVLDSATYEINDYAISGASTIWQAALGQTPTLTNGVGARTSREVNNDGNNTDTVYVSKTGSDANTGTYQSPYLTIQFAENNLGGATYINIMDSETYTEDLTINSAVTIEPIYNMIPTVGGGFTVTVDNVNIYGIIIDRLSASSDECIDLQRTGVAFAGNFNDNSLINSSGFGIRYVVDTATGTVSNNYISNVGLPIEVQRGANNGSFEHNIITNCQRGIRFVLQIAASDCSFTNNLIYNNSSKGFEITITGAFTWSGAFDNNTIWNVAAGGSGDGIEQSSSGGAVVTATIRNNIVRGSGNFDFLHTLGPVLTFTESNYGTNSGWTVGAGNITTDPEFCKITSPEKLGLSANSGAYRTDTSSDDMGAHFRMIEIDNDNIEINGFFIDGQEQINNAIYILDTANHTGTAIKWCDIFDFQGIAIDPYDDDTNTDIDILNCKIYQNGNGVKFSYGGNDVQECLIYNNAIYGIWSDFTTTQFLHCSFHANQYGIYLESNSGSIIIRDSIFHQNSLYAIFSEVSISVIYCDITGATNNVDASDSTNFTDDPLFVNITAGSEDFHLKSIEGSFAVNSSAIEAASDGKDVGAYDTSRTIANESWRKYELEFNPQVQWQNIPKGQVGFDDAEGFGEMWAKAHRRAFVLTWDAPQVSSEELRQKMEYFSTLIRKRENTLTEEETVFRLHFLPTTLLLTGTATVDTSAMTLTDATKDITENQFKGFHIGIQFATGTGTGTIASDVLTVAPSPAWTVNEWVGYYYHTNGYYYRILSNTANTLTLSDPDNTLADASNVDWNIEKYFKVTTNEGDEFTVCDGDSELIAGSYAYYIDFIECRINKTDFGYSQPKFKYDREYSKIGYSASFEEARDPRCS